MNSSGLQNGKSPYSDVRQKLFLDDEDGAAGDGHGPELPKLKKPRGQKRPSDCAAGAVDTLAVAVLLREELGRIEMRLAALEGLLHEVHDRTVCGSIVKEYYTTQEVAKLLKKRPYTVREWCRLGRVHGEKSHSGRGLDEEWRISHAELTRIQNEGLLLLKKSAAVDRPNRLK